MKHLVYGIPTEFNEQKLLLIGDVMRAYDIRSIEEEDCVKKVLARARGRGGKEAREEEKQVQTNRHELKTSNLTVGLGKEIFHSVTNEVVSWNGIIL